jgi:hypothetical protein
MDVDLRVREVWQSAGVIEVEVRHHNVLDIRRGEAKAGDLANCRGVGIVTTAEIEAEELDLEGGRVVVVKP